MKTITVEMTKQEAWALTRISAAVMDVKDDRIDQDDTLPFSWVGQRVFRMLADQDVASTEKGGGPLL
tara:strand:- start:32 stop:232 length:201 start_codon:yes stop_codon:yes gene_type:complete